MERRGWPAARAVPTCRAVMSGTGLTGSRTQARLSLKVYSTVSVPMMVQQEPSFSSSRLASFGQGDACGECHSSSNTAAGAAGDWGRDTWLLPLVSWFQQATTSLTGKQGSWCLCKDLGDNVPTEAGKPEADGFVAIPTLIWMLGPFNGRRTCHSW